MLYLFLLLLGVAALLVWLAVFLRNRLLAKGVPSGLACALFALAVALLPLGLIEAAIVLWASVVYDGTCYGFIDGRWPCSRADFTVAQASYGLFILIPVAGFHVPASLIVFILGWHRRHSIRQS